MNLRENHWDRINMLFVKRNSLVSFHIQFWAQWTFDRNLGFWPLQKKTTRFAIIFSAEKSGIIFPKEGIFWGRGSMKSLDFSWRIPPKNLSKVDCSPYYGLGSGDFRLSFTSMQVVSKVFFFRFHIQKASLVLQQISPKWGGLVIGYWRKCWSVQN